MNTQIIPLVEQAVVERLRSQDGFTALDISNALKADRYAVTHREVSEIVRDIYGSGAMGFYDYGRRLIDVVTDGGAKTAQAFLYLHNSTKERDYAARRQSSLPRVPTDAARDLSDSAPAGAALLLPRPARPQKSPNGRHRGRRRDGALAIPKTLVRRLGWAVGTVLGLTQSAGKVRLAPGGDIPVQVWGEQRVRLCQRKLRLCGLLKVDTLSMTLDGDGVRLLTEEH